MTWQRGRSRRDVELPPDWPTIRTAILERDRYRCVFCGKPANQVDHIDDPHDHRPANLRSLCTPCHAHRTARQGAAAAHAKRGTARRPPETHPGLR